MATEGAATNLALQDVSAMLRAFTESYASVTAADQITSNATTSITRFDRLRSTSPPSSPILTDLGLTTRRQSDEHVTTRRSSSGRSLLRKAPVREEDGDDPNEDDAETAYRREHAVIDDHAPGDDLSDDPANVAAVETVISAVETIISIRTSFSLTPEDSLKNIMDEQLIDSIKVDIANLESRIERLQPYPNDEGVRTALESIIGDQRLRLLELYENIRERTFGKIAKDKPSEVPPVVKFDRFGNPLSERGKPLTPWNRANGTSKTTPDASTPLKSSKSPPRQNQGGDGDDDGDDDGADDDGGDDDDDGNDDDDDNGYNNYYNYPNSRRPPGRSPSYPASRPSSAAEQATENAHRRRQLSVSLHYPKGPDLNRSKVAWLSNSIDGPYAGKSDRLAKCSFQLMDDSPSAFFVFYNSLRAYLDTCGYNTELLPSMEYMRNDADLSLTPVGLDMPPIGTRIGGDLMPPSHWAEQHERLGRGLYALFVTKNIIHASAPLALGVLAHYKFSGCGFKIMRDFLGLHHPRLAKTQAPAYSLVRDDLPTMPTHIAPCELLVALNKYYMDFSNWETHVMLYHESRHMRGSEFHLQFVYGLSLVYQPYIATERTDLLVFQETHRPQKHEPPAPDRLTAMFLCDRIRAAVSPTARHAPRSKKNSVAAITGAAIRHDLDSILEEVPPQPEQLIGWCSQIGDVIFTDEVVSALQRHAQRRQQPEKRPASLCKHLTCSKTHSPDDCCICSGQRHSIEKCWHIIGLPSGKQHMVQTYQTQHRDGTGPWAGQTSVKLIQFPAQVSAIQTVDNKPEVEPTLVIPPLNQSGVTLTEAEGDLLAVSEMDAAFRSSFILHHLETSPNVSSIPTLPEDGPEVSFVSRLKHLDTVVAHVDTGATVMVSNVDGELHGTIPTKAHCGTAMTGSRATIDALGTWMVDLVGSVEGDDLSLALRGTTQITEFQRRSLSLHALKELGFDCAHVLTQHGNFLEITANKVKHVFPLLTINGGDYVEMRIHRPPPPNVANLTVARLDLAKNFKADGLYHLLHLRYGCPGKRQMELILKSGCVTGVPVNVVIPEFFRCPICDKEKTNSLPRNEISDRTFLPIGVRFHADFGFYKTASVRGFRCFLLVSEAVTGYKWTFCRRSKHPPVNLLLWFIRQLRLRMGSTFAILRTDGGGELWGSHDLRERLTKEAHCTLEPTGSYNSAANGLVERGIGVLCVQTQLCLFASGLDVSFWCFAMSHAAMLCNFRPQVDTKTSSHEAFFKKKPNYSNLAIWGSPVYVVDRRLTRRRPESATITGRFLGYAGSHNIITYKNDTTGAIQYAHHTAIDELDLQKLPGDRGPAARVLSGIITDGRHELELRQAIADLTPTLSPWLSNQLVSYHVPYDVTCNVLGIVTEHERQFDRMRMVGLTPGSPAERHLANKNVIGTYILSMNGVRIRSLKDIRHILHDYHDLEPARGPAYLTGITILFGVPDPTSLDDPQPLEFTEQDHATARVVWALVAGDLQHESLANETEHEVLTTSPDPTPKQLPSKCPTNRIHITGGGTDTERSKLELHDALLPPIDNDTLAFVQAIIFDHLALVTDVDPDELRAFVSSILRSDLHPTCPKFWHHAMKDPVHKGKWIEAMFKHLDSCYAIGTFGPPRIPPAGVTVLPAVIVLKMILNSAKQINSHKVRVCVHGGHQEQGRDFDESFAHTVLGRSIKICVAISCHLGWLIFHFDIHNAFQTCPDDDPNKERTWLRINQAWLDYYRERHPTKWHEVQELLDKSHTPEQFAVEMFMFVQGRTDASRKWGELVEEFIFSDLALLPNRADPCTYSGIYAGQPVILCRATDDFLLMCEHKDTYDAMITVFRKKWTVHALDEVKLFFGIRFICSPACVTMDQSHKIKDIVSEVFGPSAHLQPPGKGYSTPMIAGTEHANELASGIPYNPAELHTAQSTTYAFVFRHILGSCMHCALWTRLDILPACLILAQYQAQPGKIHFHALKHLVGYLRLHPDIPLTFKRSTTIREIATINFELLDEPLTAQVNGLNLEITPTSFNIPFESNPSSFTSCDNYFITTESQTRAEVNRIAPPVTECLVDANLPGGLFERMAMSGGSIEMNGTTVIQLCSKQTTMAESSTEAEIAAAAMLGRILRWLVLFMSDIGLPFQGPIPIAEDNAATRIIAHSGKITRNVRHVAIKTLSLQALVRNHVAVFNAIGTDKNRSDHFTKPLPFPAFRSHITTMMGIRFLSREHASLTQQRNKEEQENG